MKYTMNHNVIYIDIETRSEIDIKKTSTYNYANHESTETIVICYTFDDEETVHAYYPLLEGWPRELAEFTGTIIAHNFWFEYYIFCREHRANRMPAHFADIKNYDCTMARAYAAGLPGALEDLSSVLNLKHQKHAASGKGLISRYSKKYLKTHKDIFAGEQRQGLQDMTKYCAEDVLATRDAAKIIPPLCDFEKQVFEFDKIKNSRGLQIDLKTVNNLITLYETAAEKTKTYAKNQWGENEHGTLIVNSPTELPKLLAEHGVQVENARAETLTEAYDSTDSDKAKKIIEARRTLSTSNVKKIYAMIEYSDEQGVARNSTQYYYALTGRDAGRGMQPQNLYGKKLDVSFAQRMREIKQSANSDDINDVLKAPKLINTVLRGCITARKDNTFLIADFSTIEPRVLFYIAQAQAGLKAFNDDLDIYTFFSAYRFQKSMQVVTPAERAWGKLAILSFGYGQAAKSAAAVAGVDVSIATDLQQHYLQLFPEVPAIWSQLYSDVVTAIRNCDNSITQRHGYAVQANPTRLKLTLMSGRSITLFRPHIRDRQPYCYDRKGVLKLWHGRLINYLVQGTARDIMKVASQRAEAAGYRVGLEVHDEIVAETADEGAAKNKHKLKEFIDILEKPVGWFPDMIKADGQVSKRYKKI